MRLTDGMIERALKAGQIGISPLVPRNLQPASYDVRLGRELIVDPDGRRSRIRLEDGQPYMLHPHCLVLASTIETIKLDAQHEAIVDGKSTLARRGLSIHQTAGYIDPGFEGQVTLELSLVGDSMGGPLRLYAGQLIGQVRFSRLPEPVKRPYGSEGLGSHYQGQRGPTLAAAHGGDDG